MSWSSNGVCPYYSALPGALTGAPPPISQLGARNGNTTEVRCVEEGRPRPQRGQKGRREEDDCEEAGEAVAEEVGQGHDEEGGEAGGQEGAREAANGQEGQGIRNEEGEPGEARPGEDHGGEGGQ